MSRATTNVRKVAVKDYAPIRCVLEMADDSHIAVIVCPGCSVEDVCDMLRHLPADGHFEHLIFVDEDEDLTRRSRQCAGASGGG
jgi:hypothetical protein